MDGWLRMWRADDGAPLAAKHIHEGSVADAIYGANGFLYSIGEDGRLMKWSRLFDIAVPLFEHDAPFLGMVPVQTTAASTVIFVYDTLGSLFSIDLTTLRVKTVAAFARDQIRMAFADPVRGVLIAGTARGLVVCIDIATGRVREILRASAPIRDIDISRIAPLIVVATEDGTVTLHSLDGSTTPPWSHSERHARYARFSPRGDILVLAGANGSLWLEKIFPEWTPYMSVAHKADTLSAYFSKDGRYLVSADVTGSVIKHDISAIFGESPRIQNENTKE